MNIVTNPLQVKTQSKRIEISFNQLNRLCILNMSIVKDKLSDIVKIPDTKLIINLQGIKFIDSTAFNDLNYLSEKANTSNSSISLINIEPPVMELIALIKKHSKFKIKEYSELRMQNKVA